MKKAPRAEDRNHEEVDLYNLHNLTSEEREELHIALRPDKNGHRSPSRSPVYNRRQKRLKFLPGEEVGAVTEQMFVCPNCKHEIKLTEAISAPVVERLRKQFEAETRKKGEELARREKAKKAIDA